MSAHASSLCKSGCARPAAPAGPPRDPPHLFLLFQVRRWPSGRCQYQYSGPQNPEGDYACDRDSGVHKLSGGSGTPGPPGHCVSPRARLGRGRAGFEPPGQGRATAMLGLHLYIGVGHTVSTRRVQRSLIPSLSPSHCPRPCGSVEKESWVWRAGGLPLLVLAGTAFLSVMRN